MSLLKEIDTRLAPQQEVPISDDPLFKNPPSDGRSADYLPYGVDTIVIPFTWSDRQEAPVSGDSSSQDLPPDGRSAGHLPYGVETIVIPFTWSGPQRRRLPWRRFGGYKWVTGPYPPSYVGQSCAIAERQFALALKDARLTSTELALSALRPNGGGTADADGAGTQGQDRVSVPGPGPASSHLFGLYQTPSRQSDGTVPGVPGASWQLDRDTETLSFYQQNADGSRTLTRSLQVQGDQVLAPNGQALGRVHADGGFDLDSGYLAGLGLCPLPGFTADSDASNPQAESFPADPTAGQPQTESFPVIPPSQQVPDSEALTPPDELQGPQVVTMARPKGMPEELEKRRAVIAGKGLPTGGSVSYVPPAKWTSSQPLPRGKQKGYLDADGNEWVKAVVP